MTFKDRFARQERLTQVGVDGQAVLSEATFAIVGLGALGNTMANWLVRAGAKKIILIDRDVVEWSNLQRQSLFNEEDAKNKTPKSIAAANHLKQFNSKVLLSINCCTLDNSNINDLLEGTDVILDGSDNFYTRYLLNDYAVKNAVPFIYCGATATYGMCGPILPQGPCLRCLYPEPPAPGTTPTCATAGIFGPTIGTIASIATSMAIQALLNPKQDYTFFHCDLWPLRNVTLQGKVNENCPCCQNKDFEFLNAKKEDLPEVNCDQNMVRIKLLSTPNISQFSKSLEGVAEDIESSDFFLKFKYKQCEFFMFPDGTTQIYGTGDVELANQLTQELTA